MVRRPARGRLALSLSNKQVEIEVELMSLVDEGVKESIGWCYKVHITRNKRWRGATTAAEHCVWRTQPN